VDLPPPCPSNAQQRDRRVDPDAFIMVGLRCECMTDDRLAAAEERIRQLEERLNEMERIIDGLADVIRPRRMDPSQGRITRWMRD
jgi:hypothetical protein